MMSRTKDVKIRNVTLIKCSNKILTAKIKQKNAFNNVVSSTRCVYSPPDHVTKLCIYTFDPIGHQFSPCTERMDMHDVLSSTKMLLRACHIFTTFLAYGDILLDQTLHKSLRMAKSSNVKIFVRV